MFATRSQDDPGQLRKVTGRPGDPGQPGGSVGAGGAALDGAATPVPGRLQRLGRAVDRARGRGPGREVRKLMQVAGMAGIGVGLLCIVLGWYGAAHSPYLFQEIPYLISGGVLGLALVIAGGVLVRCAWSLRQVEEDRLNALAIVRSVDRLERVLRSLHDEERSRESETTS